MLPNYYDILGIPFDSTKSDIKSRYRQLAKKYHPDKNDSPDATSKMQTIQEAKYILYDDEARKRYDIQYAILYGLKSDPNQQQNTNSAEQKRYCFLVFFWVNSINF